MRPPRALEIFQLILALVFSNIPVILFILLLSPTGPLWSLFLFISVIPVLYFFRLLVKDHLSFWFSTVILLLYIGAAFIIVANIVIVPFSAFVSWFRLAAKGKTEGSIAFTLSMALGFFSAYGGAQVFKNGIIRPFLGIAAASAFILTVIYGFHWLKITTVSLLFLGVLLIPLLGAGKKKWAQVLPKLWSGTAVLLLAALVSLPVLFTAPPQGSRFIWAGLSPALKELTLSLFPNFPLIYGTPGYGYGFSNEELGRRPVLSDQAIFSIQGEAGERYYLRNVTYDLFSGNSWTRSTDLSEPEPEEAEKAREEIFGSIEAASALWLTLEGEFFSHIPHTLDTVQIELPSTDLERDYDSEDLITGTKDGGFVLTEPIIKGSRIGLLLHEGVTIELPDEERRRYLSLPDRIDEEVQELAETLKGENPFTTIENIKNYLRSGYGYSLDTSTPGREGDFLKHFLFESGVGFCVHFTTAFVILSRLNDIPARYVSGFLVYMPGNSERGVVSGLDSHAWPEVYLPEDGWTRYEATAPMNPEYYSELDMFFPFMGDMDQYTSRQLSAILGDRLPTSPQEEQVLEDQVDKDKGTVFSWIPIIGMILGGLAFAFLLVLALRYLLIRVKPSLELRDLAERIKKAGISEGVPSPERIGWIRWSEEMSKVLSRKARANGRNSGRRLRSEHLHRSSELLLQHFFSTRELQHRDFDYLRAVEQRLKRL